MNVRSMKQWSSLVKEALDGTFLVTKFLCLLHVTNTYLCTVAVTYGPRMLPMLSLTGDLVDLGDVVLVRSPENPRKVVTKRVVGVEGDRVTYFVDPKNSDRCQTILLMVAWCSKCGRLAIDGKSSLLLPPVCRPHRYFSPVKVSSTQPISSTRDQVCSRDIIWPSA
ncbi:hypothetical protein K2173_005593 [Erythroxylum novogranatense]|uniref:Peptidase S26 domain-containing protein n=1 Tax=Erythroxylum novogranatense TaxID=1862640 RepID=A0AAV8T5A0_9ROSI|nr:hypothetical protein K2173_005593 [Erythroxylum novogranatense]